ncbi:MAG: VCBS repeat-containing protein [Candidatus Alcyoniella australis]|nr:VCBS repeat-containing protein [Candidatus Alcyoniella australis]
MNKALATALLFALLIAPPAWAGFAPAQIELPGVVQELLVAQLDGREGPELLLVYMQGLRPNQSIGLRVLRGDDPQAEALAELTPPPGATFFDLADVDGDGAQELLYLTGRSVIAQPALGGPTRELVRIDTFALAADDDSLPFQDFARDWTGEGRDSLLIPTRDSLVLFKRSDDGGFERACAVEFELHADNVSQGQDSYNWAWGSYESHLLVPLIALVDADGDGLRDLTLTQRDTVRVHYAQRGEQGIVFSQQPSIQRRFAVLTEQEQKLNNTAVRVNLTQIDADGRADAVVLKYGGGLKDMRSSLAVFRGIEGGFSQSPDFALESQGVASNAQVIDINADGRDDLVLPYVKIGLFEIASALLTGAIDVDYNVYLFRADGLYPAKPDLSVSAKYLADYRSGISLVGINPDFGGDFNSDGRRDLLFGLDKQRTAISLGRNSEPLFDDPDLTIEVEPSVRVLIRDFNGDGRDDLIYLYTFEPNLERVVKLFANDGQW